MAALVRAYLYPRLDSLIWTSTQSVGAQTRVLAFDPENGLEAYVDRGGVPGWVDLRVGTVKPSRVSKLAVMTLVQRRVVDLRRDAGHNHPSVDPERRVGVRDLPAGSRPVPGA